MEDRLENAIAGYNVTVRRRYRSRGGWLLETNDGPRLLREYDSVRCHFDLENKIKEHLMQRGFVHIDEVVPTRADNLVLELENGEKYIMYRWFPGEECNLRSVRELALAGENLGRLHGALEDFDMESITKETQEEEKQNLPREENLLSLYLRHNRELGRVNRYMKNKKRKTEFEIQAINCFYGYYEKACEAAKRLENSDYYKAICQSDKTLCHGDYNYHNLILFEKGVATVGFEKAGAGIPLLDLTYFMRKTLEKNEWQTEAGEAVLDGYQKAMPLEEAQLEFVGIMLRYPEKYWKLLNQYFNKKKSWLSAKSLEKLKNVGNQEVKREKFLRFFEGKYC